MSVPKKTGACTHCKRLKMKCDFPERATSCKRCTSGGHPCIVQGRKPRIAPNKKEYLLAQIRHKDQIIESLLKQLHNPYIATPLSITSFKLATSPSDKDNVRIADWMDRLQASTRTPGQPSAARMQMLRELRDPGAATATTAMEDSDDGHDGEEETTEEEDAEKVRSALPDAVVPIGLLADLSLDKDKDKGKGRGRQGGGGGGSGGGGGTSSSHVKPEDDDDNVGVANKEYFMPGPANNLNIRKNLIEQHSPPDIVLHGLVTPADVDKLFEIFWNQINPFIGLLDPKLHTASTIFQRCPFLFTVICAISSRYYPAKSEIYPVAMHFAKHSAANALIDGWKSVELCQAYILMSIYAVPARRWEEDRSWLYTGLAVRIATDLNLHQVSTIQPQTERQEREILNRTRVWMICFNVDRSTATQFGKPSTIKEDYITRNSTDWYKRSRYRDKYDIHLCAYSSLLRIVGRFHDDIFSDPTSPTGLNKSINFLAVTLQHDERLTAYFEEWTMRFNEESDHDDPGCAFRCTLLPFLVNYSRLVMYSFGFQHAFQRGMEASDHVFLTKCFEAATVVIKHMIEVLTPSGLMRSAPDGHFIFASFASAFLLKLLRPEFAQLLTREMEDEIFELIGRLISTLQDVAIDERHTPRLYARFLAGLLTRHRKGGGGVGGRSQMLPPSSQLAHQRQQQSYSKQRPPSSSQMPYSGLQSQGTSETRHDSEAMQMKLSPVPRAVEAPPPSHPHPVNVPMVNNASVSPELTYTETHPPLPHGETTFVDTDVGMADVLSDAGTLATMHALNDVWWGNMMMPGFSWPDATPLMSSLNDGRTNGIPGIHPGFGGFLAPEVQLAM
ncbi:fungal-specific transcription factor domain-containing protein [Phlebopus sp. FC_14]|nr:fungal-specific transcription factor domain-containing protein [Phlebopus sp. FC_14]